MPKYPDTDTIPPEELESVLFTFYRLHGKEMKVVTALSGACLSDFGEDAELPVPDELTYLIPPFVWYEWTPLSWFIW